MERRELLQLAHKYKPDKPKTRVAGWYISEKLDGSRLWWDGGISRGLRTDTVPYAGLLNPKTDEPKKKVKPYATGLWSRYGNPVIAPDWFLDSLPETFLDGEIWAGRGKFQLCRSIVAGDKPDPRWDQVQYMVYGLPSPDLLFAPGRIKIPQLHLDITAETLDWVESRIKPGFVSMGPDTTFEEEWSWMKALLAGREHVYRHKQICLPNREDDAREAIEVYLKKTVDNGGEGVILRDSESQWTPKRVNTLLKYKPYSDAEATVTGFTSGRETNLGSKHLGKIGALITEYQGKRLEVSGLTDAERMFRTEEMEEYATEHPGKDMPDWFRGISFKPGQVITFKYRELSDAGIPKEASYLRDRCDM